MKALHWTVCTVSIAILIGAAVVAGPPRSYAGYWEWRSDRPGGDYKTFQTENDQGDICSRVCWGDPACKAWTWVRPGVQGAGAVCWLKASVPAPKWSDCCNSGAIRQ